MEWDAYLCKYLIFLDLRGLSTFTPPIILPMLHLGITGGIGSGKTTVCKIFETLGIPIYYADERARALMIEDPALKAEIIQLLGAEAYLSNGELNRKWVASQVFNKPEKLKQLNGLVHPAVARDGLLWQAEQEKGDAPFSLKEAALLYESGSHLFLYKIIVVSAPEKVRIQRVISRDGATEAEVRSRMDKQMPEQEKVERADYVIDNSGKQALIPQVMSLYKDLKALAYAQ